MNNKEQKRFVTTAALAAIVFVLGLTPLGIIPLGFVNVTILCIPVVVGTVILGLRSGLIIGGCFALASTLRAFGIPTAASALVEGLVEKQPIYAVIMSVVPRLLIPITVYYSNIVLKEKGTVCLITASVCGSLTNTVLYLGMMVFFYWLCGLNVPEVLTMITATGILAGGTEAAVAAILCPSIILALRKAHFTFE